MRTATHPAATRRRAFALVPACALALALAACHHAPPPPSNATPDQAVATNLRLTATGDFDALMKNRLPPADYAAWRADWDKQHAQPLPATVAQQKQFAEIMRMLTEPGAEANLVKRLQPMLADARGGKGAPLPVFGSIVEAAIRQMIVESPQLGPTQRTLATQGLEALTAWAKTTDFGDAKKASKAIALVCATARNLHVQTLEQWRALDYAASMRNYGIIWNGLEKLLHLYGFDLADSLTGATIRTVTSDGDQAIVKLQLTLANQSLAGQWPMRKQDGHWYDVALLDAWWQAHPAPVQSASAAPAPVAMSAIPGGAPSATTAQPPAASTRRPGPGPSGGRRD